MDVDINKYEVKRYTHFDNRISIDKVIDSIKNPRWVAKHGFLPSHLDYLSFSFDGHNVKTREKSLFKFYSRAYQKIRVCNLKTAKYGRKKNRITLYRKYSHLGKLGNGYGNFLSYASRAQKVFDENSSTNNLMELQVKNHWKYINNRLI